MFRRPLLFVLCLRPFAFALAMLPSPIRVAAEPPVTILLPGFTVRELPVQLTNVNNLRFSPDGRLTALGYDGRIHLLTDRDGDGLEDTATPFWDKPTLSVPVGMAWTRDGLYVSSKGKVSLLRDTDGDGRADEEQIITSGWPATDVASGGVDATAVTLDPAGNVYFGLLTANYANPYRLKNGVARYELASPRGTIQKWSPATRQRETIATGIRVPYTLAFNRQGDLFVTDQEGETWVPGGNPVDELNHIVLGRNYGFPPRHDTHLPGLISEAPVIGFGPQHQSTCGFVFNEPTPQQGHFGPADWAGEAIVAGESRGKLWRARLLKTAGGYVGREITLARLGLLTLDVAISRAGDLYVACHTGNPDWGTGPKGAGRLFRISHTDSAAPQPTAIWASAPQEIRIAFDRPIDPSVTREFGAITIEFGEYLTAADRREVLTPPYKAVKAQRVAPRGKLRVVAARLSTDGRTLALTSDPHPQAVNYALTLPGVRAAGGTGAAATVDLAYTLDGVAAIWTPDDRNAAEWRGWLPHLNLDVSAHFTTHSTEHEQLFTLLRRPGRLRLQTQLAPAAGRGTLQVASSAPFSLAHAGATRVAEAQPRDGFATGVEFDASRVPATITIELTTGAGVTPRLEATVVLAGDPTRRALPFSAFLPPWTTPHRPAPAVDDAKEDLAGGDYERGRKLFSNEKLACAACHAVRGEGGALGPDLSNLAHRDAASVLRDIREPSATLNPDYVSYVVQLRGGGSAAGYVRAQDHDTLRLVRLDGTEQAITRAAVADLRPSPVSLMPAGLLDGVGDAAVRDLLTFLTSGPPARSAAELAAVLRPSPGVPAPAAPERPLMIVLVASRQDHGPGQHDYPAWQKRWQGLLTPGANLTVATAWDWPTAAQWAGADAMVFNYRKKFWSAEHYAQLDAFQARGGGLVFFHAATIVDREPGQLATRIGLAAQPGPTKYRHMPMTLKFTGAAGSGIARNFKPLTILDEPYWPMFGQPEAVTLLASADVDGAARPLVWTFEKGPGRVFVSIPGHYTWTFDDPVFQVLALRGLAWACREPAARFEQLGAGPTTANLSTP